MNIQQTITCFSLCLMALCTLATTPTFAQTVTHVPLFTFDSGDSTSDLFGWSVSGAGDVNGDGFSDLIVGARDDDFGGVDSGSARVLSGVDGSILYNFYGDSSYDRFGWSVSGAGDVNADGFDDFIVGARNNRSGASRGSARVFSGIDGSILYNFVGDSPDDLFGESVSGAGDVNGDGFADFIVGAWRDDNNGSRSGSARVFSGIDGSVLYNFDGESANELFGYSVSGAGDVNGDGFADLMFYTASTVMVQLAFLATLSAARAISMATGLMISLWGPDLMTPMAKIAVVLKCSPELTEVCSTTSKVQLVKSLVHQWTARAMSMAMGLPI